MRIRDIKCTEQCNKEIRRVFRKFDKRKPQGDEDFWNTAEDIYDLNKRYGNYLYRLAELWDKFNPYNLRKI